METSEDNKVGIKFSINLDRFFDFCALNNAQSSEIHQKEITDSYELNEEDKTINLSNKIVHEIVSPSDSLVHPEKYEVLKMLLSIVLSEEKGNFGETPLSYKLAFNTLVNNKIIE